MIPKNELKIEYTKGKGPGGQNKNKVHSCVKLTHIPTGITVRIDGRDRGQNYKVALKELEKRLEQSKLDEKAKERKARRDRAIKNEETIRTYDFKSGTVKDHRTGKTASIKDVLIKGKFDLITIKPNGE